jgi:hypothetical protein
MTDYPIKKASLTAEDAATYRRWRYAVGAIYGGMLLTLFAMWGVHWFAAPGPDVQSAGSPVKEASRGEPATRSR